MAERILRILDSVVSFTVFLAIIVGTAFSAYALWDDRRVYAAADNVRDELLALKPDGDSKDGESFESLKTLNPDVCAWLTLNGTDVDCPVVQGGDNLHYLNTDVYGNFALAGSIFLDSRCGRDFGDGYCLLYGHHMDNGRMFGELDRYKDKKFFGENRGGRLILPHGVYALEIFACVVVPASDKIVFTPGSGEGLVDTIVNNSVNLDLSILEKLRGGGAQILGMSTCATDFTDARTVVFAVTEKI